MKKPTRKHASRAPAQRAELKQLKKRTPPPSGLITMMSLVRGDGDNGNAADWLARHAYPLARRVIRELRGAEVTREWDSLDNIAIEMFPGLEDEPPADGTLTQAGFYVGVATAWLLLQDINGKVGAR